MGEGASLVKGDDLRTGTLGGGFIEVQGHLLLVKPPPGHCAMEEHHEGESRGRGIHQHVQDGPDMKPGRLVEGGRLDEIGDVGEELQAEGEGVQAKDILGKASAFAVSTCAVASKHGTGKDREGRQRGAPFRERRGGGGGA